LPDKNTPSHPVIPISIFSNGEADLIATPSRVSVFELLDKLLQSKGTGTRTGT
jgi:hypothetical protein